MRGEDSIIFNVGAEEYVPFKDLKCYAYDLINDENKLHAIKPELVGDDGLTKKIKIKFLRKLQQYDHFKIEFTFEFLHCMKYGKDYITFTTSYLKRIQYLKNILIFKGDYPERIELYKKTKGSLKYNKVLFPKKDGRYLVYTDYYKIISRNLE